MLKSLLLTAAVLVLICFSVSAQTSDADEPEPVMLPNQVMKQVVGSILRSEFKTGRSRKEIFLLEEGIERSWLPQIKNVNFVLISQREMVIRGLDVHFFRGPKLDEGTYTIDFGYGDPDCGATGDTWSIKISSNGVNTEKGEEGWGTGCSRGIPKVKDLQLGEHSPNEIPGFEFFGKGKLREIKLGISTREDIVKIFGKTCERPCDYDSSWRVWINYFDEQSGGIGRSLYADERETQTLFTLRPQFLGTVRFVTLIPKDVISLRDFTFPPSFRKGNTYSVGHIINATLDTYTDGFGLSYFLHKEVTLNLTDDSPNVHTGDLVRIEYTIPNQLEDILYWKQLLTEPSP